MGPEHRVGGWRGPHSGSQSQPAGPGVCWGREGQRGALGAPARPGHPPPPRWGLGTALRKSKQTEVGAWPEGTPGTVARTRPLLEPAAAAQAGRPGSGTNGAALVYTSRVLSDRCSHSAPARWGGVTGLPRLESRAWWPCLARGHPPSPRLCPTGLDTSLPRGTPAAPGDLGWGQRGPLSPGCSQQGNHIPGSSPGTSVGSPAHPGLRQWVCPTPGRPPSEPGPRRQGGTQAVSPQRGRPPGPRSRAPPHSLHPPAQPSCVSPGNPATLNTALPVVWRGPQPREVGVGCTPCHSRGAGRGGSGHLCRRKNHRMNSVWAEMTSSRRV